MLYAVGNLNIYIDQINFQFCFFLWQEYEEPLYKRNIISHDRVKVIFKHIHEIIQCHQLFHMALSDRMSKWLTQDLIGDVLSASVRKKKVFSLIYLHWCCCFSNQWSLETYKKPIFLFEFIYLFIKKLVTSWKCILQKFVIGRMYQFNI